MYVLCSNCCALNKSSLHFLQYAVVSCLVILLWQCGDGANSPRDMLLAGAGSNLTPPRETSLGTVREDATADSTPRRAATVLGTPSRRFGRQSTAGSRQITDGPVCCLAAPPELTDASTNIPFSLNVLTVDVFLLH